MIQTSHRSERGSIDSTKGNNTAVPKKEIMGGRTPKGVIFLGEIGREEKNQRGGRE